MEKDVGIGGVAGICSVLGFLEEKILLKGRVPRKMLERREVVGRGSSISGVVSSCSSIVTKDSPRGRADLRLEVFACGASSSVSFFEGDGDRESGVVATEYHDRRCSFREAVVLTELRCRALDAVEVDSSLFSRVAFSSSKNCFTEIFVLPRISNPRSSSDLLPSCSSPSSGVVQPGDATESGILCSGIGTRSSSEKLALVEKTLCCGMCSRVAAGMYV